MSHITVWFRTSNIQIRLQRCDLHQAGSSLLYTNAFFFLMHWCDDGDLLFFQTRLFSFLVDEEGRRCQPITMACHRAAKTRLGEAFIRWMGTSSDPIRCGYIRISLTMWKNSESLIAVVVVLTFIWQCISALTLWLALNWRSIPPFTISSSNYRYSLSNYFHHFSDRLDI